MARFLRDNPGSSSPEENYREFHEFYKELWNKHPLEMWKMWQYNTDPDKQNPFYKILRNLPQPLRVGLSRFIG
jgi:hypothetical protein